MNKIQSSLIYIFTATFFQGLITLVKEEAVFLLFILSAISLTIIRDIIDKTKTVTGIKIAWSLVVIVILCGLLRAYKHENGMSDFWLYLSTVSIGVFAPSAVYKIMQNSDEKAEKGFGRIVNAFFVGIEFRINQFFGVTPKTDQEIENEQNDKNLTDGE